MQSSGKLLTIAARVCPTYKDVTANRARNNIQESLQDLGPDTLYTAGHPIDPVLEDQGQPNPPCKPLPNWKFTLGTGIIAGASVGPWGSLSVVSGAFSTPIVTEPSIPLLNDQSQDTGNKLDGAVTIELTPAQAALAAASSRLWIQGGTVTDPVLDQEFPGQYGFAALRCAEDNLNGDNVEWITYPAGASHVFCYAYYVQPPPTSGTITVVKHVSSPAGATQTFPFHGNISFNPGGFFALNVSNGNDASITLFRSETRPNEPLWSFTEDVPPGWHLSDISCTSQTGSSVTTASVATATTTVHLAAEDHVTCTYTDSQTPPPPGNLSITKTTLGGVGTFDYTITPADGGTSATASATTTTPGVPEAAAPASLQLSPGRYTIAEKLPSSNRGTWALTGVTCNGMSLPVANPVTVALEPSGSTCNFVNTFTPRGVIRIEKIAYGNTGTAGFQITPLGSLPQDVAYQQTAEVKQQGVPVVATGDKTNELPLGTYKIQEFAAGGTNPQGWALTSVVCNGQLLAASQGAVTVTLTAARQRMRCIFTNTWTPGPSPPEPPTPVPPDPTPTADIRVNKTPDRVTAEVGDTVTYTVKVSNAGDAAPAQGVILAEQTPLLTSTILSITTTQGTCRFDHYPASCDLGIIEPGKTVTVTVKLKATHVGSMPNNVAVNSATDVFRPPTDHTGGRVRARPRPKPVAVTG